MGVQYGFGSGVLYGLRTDIVGSTPIKFGTLQDVSVDFNGEIKELFGQLQYPVDTARGKTKIQGKAKFAQISALAFNSLFFGESMVSGQTLPISNEAQVVTAGSPTIIDTNASALSGATSLAFASTTGAFVGAPVSGTNIAVGTTVTALTSTTVTLSTPTTGVVASGAAITFGGVPSATAANAATFSQDLGVTYASGANIGAALTYVAPGGALTVGQYSVNPTTGVYTFSEADLGASVQLNYLYTATTGNTISLNNLLMGTTPRFQAIFTQVYNGNSLVLKLLACTSSKLTLPTKIDDYVINELDFEAYANAAGLVGTLSTSQ
jgi:hypothetical protein